MRIGVLPCKERCKVDYEPFLKAYLVGPQSFYGRTFFRISRKTYVANTLSEEKWLVHTLLLLLLIIFVVVVIIIIIIIIISSSSSSSSSILSARCATAH